MEWKHHHGTPLCYSDEPQPQAQSMGWGYHAEQPHLGSVTRVSELHIVPESLAHPTDT